VRSVEDFERMLMRQMPAGTQVYGCMEYHADGVPHFHAVVCFNESKYFPDAKKQFTLVHDDGAVDTRSIHFKVPKKDQEVEPFLARTQRYCGKDGNTNTFGTKIVYPLRGGMGQVRCVACLQVGEAQGRWVCVGCTAHDSGEELMVSRRAADVMYMVMLCAGEALTVTYVDCSDAGWDCAAEARGEWARS
jgi:hypothetical protein